MTNSTLVDRAAISFGLRVGTAPRAIAPGARCDLVAVLCGFVLVCAPAHASSSDTRCVLAAGGAATNCVKRYAEAIASCRGTADAACEAALRVAGGALGRLLAATEAPVRAQCTADAADRLTSFLGLDDLVVRTAQACRKWSEDFVDLAFADEPAGLGPEALGCQRIVAHRLARLRNDVVHAYGRHCYVTEFAGRVCDRARRDRRVAVARTGAHARIIERCGTTFDSLGLVSSASGALLDDRVDALVDTIVGRARHLAQRVYPPFNLGPTAFFGPRPVGVRTLDLVDPSRRDTTGTGPRPVKTEVYYPSTAAAVAGVPRDIVRLFGIDILATPTYRDVARSAGRFPMVLYSASSGGPRFENTILAAHLASHGFIVVAAEHHGNEQLDPEGDPDTLVNRPRDLSFLIDRFLAFDAEAGNFLEGAIDGARIGATGHSYGGYTAMALATGSFHLGTFTDARVRAIFPLDGSAQVFVPQFPGIFSTISVPTLLLTGSHSLLEGLFMQPAYDALVPGPAVMAEADLLEAGHLTFNDICEVPDGLLAALGGAPVSECEPESLPWRYAHHIVDYLALNFFDGVLNGNAEALARLDPAVLSGIEALTYQSK